MTDKDEDPSPKKRKPGRPRKKKIEKPEESSQSEENKGIQNDALKDQIADALMGHLSDYAKKKNLSRKQVQTLNSFIEEHLSCFVLLGYTHDGNTLSVVNAHTQKNSDALGTLLQKFIVRNVDPPPYPPMG